MRIIIIIAVALLSFSANAQSFSIAEFSISNPAGAVAKRSQIISAISGGQQIVAPRMATFNGYGNGGDPVGYFGITPSSALWLAWYWDMPSQSNSVVARTYFATFPGSTCLFIYNAGHGQGFFATSPDENFSPTATRDYIRRVITQLKCDVILSSMPFMGENRNFSAYVGLPPQSDHNTLGASTALQPTSGNKLRYFVDSVKGSIDYALSLRSYDKVIMSGLSGGGWTTTLVAAIDPRITHSYAIAGSVPLAYRSGAEGDWEQIAGMSLVDVDYHDLYLIGTVDANGNPTRKVGLLYNGFDACCFKGPVSASFGGWLVMYASLNGFGSVRVFNDPTKTTHAVHQSHVDAIFDDINGQ